MLVNTSLISIGVYLETHQPIWKFWKEHYSWLFTIYVGMGVVSAAFVFGYKHDPLIGSLLVLVPLLLLRVSQAQYVERTKDMVAELREKNKALELYSIEITDLNEGLARYACRGHRPSGSLLAWTFATGDRFGCAHLRSKWG